MKKTKQIEAHSLYIVLNEHAQVWVGIRSGDELVFSDNINDAKPLENEEQFNCLKRMSFYKLEKIFL